MHRPHSTSLTEEQLHLQAIKAIRERIELVQEDIKHLVGHLGFTRYFLATLVDLIESGFRQAENCHAVCADTKTENHSVIKSTLTKLKKNVRECTPWIEDWKQQLFPLKIPSLEPSKKSIEEITALTKTIPRQAENSLLSMTWKTYRHEYYALLESAEVAFEKTESIQKLLERMPEYIEKYKLVSAAAIRKAERILSPSAALTSSIPTPSPMSGTAITTVLLTEAKETELKINNPTSAGSASVAHLAPPRAAPKKVDIHSSHNHRLRSNYSSASMATYKAPSVVVPAESAGDTPIVIAKKV